MHLAYNWRLSMNKERRLNRHRQASKHVNKTTITNIDVHLVHMDHCNASDEKSYELSRGQKSTIVMSKDGQKK